MSGFVATAPTTQADPGDTDTIRNDGWFPDLALSTIRATIRLDGTVTDERLRDAARYAIASINTLLGEFKATAQAAGSATIADVSPAEIDSEKRLVMLYRRAVFSTIKADLLERYRDFDSTDSGLRRVLDMEDNIGEQRRNASWAVRDILGKPHTVVELI
ncbi:MAG TPA: head completion/stabilization protein [Lysobacter sp.]